MKISENVLPMVLFGSFFGAFVGFIATTVDRNDRADVVRDEAVRLGYARYEIKEQIHKHRMGRESKSYNREFKWNDHGSGNCLKILQEEAVAKGYAKWFKLDNGSRGFDWVEPKGQN